MDIFTTSREILNHGYIMEQFAKTSVESILQKSYTKLALSKLRWVPITMGISHYLLSDMPLLDFIMISTSIEEIIHNGDDFNQTAFYRILATRNILILLKRAYAFNSHVQDFYDLSILQVIEVAKENGFEPNSNIAHIFDKFSLNGSDNIQKMTTTISELIEPILKLAKCKNITCSLLASGSDKEQSILDAYELYYVFFQLIFAKVFEDDFSENNLGEKYHCRDIWNDFELKFINGIRQYDV